MHVRTSLTLYTTLCLGCGGTFWIGNRAFLCCMNTSVEPSSDPCTFKFSSLFHYLFACVTWSKHLPVNEPQWEVRLNMTSGIRILLKHCVSSNTLCCCGVKALYAHLIGQRSYLTDAREMYVLIIGSRGVRCGWESLLMILNRESHQ